MKSTKPAYADGGVSFALRSSETEKGGLFDTLFSTLMNCLLTAALGIGGLYTFLTMYRVPINHAFFAVYVTLLTVGATLLCRLPRKKAVGLGLLGVYGAVVLTGLLFSEAARDGLVYVKDFVIAAISRSMYWDLPELSYKFVPAMELQTTFFACLLATAVIPAIAYLATRRHWFLITFALTVPFFEIGAFMGCVPHIVGFSALFAGRLGLFALSMSAHVKRIRRRRGEKKRRVPAVQKPRQIATVGAGIAVVTFVLFLVGNGILSAAGYNYAETMKQVRIQIHEVSYDLWDYITGEDHDGSLKDGRLYKMEKRDVKNRRYFEVTMPLQEISYFRGFVGVSYAGDRWLPGDETTDMDKALTERVTSTGYYPQNMAGILLASEYTTGRLEEVESFTVTIERLRRQKDYAFSLYTPNFDSTYTFAGDTVATPEDRSSYAYTVFSGKGARVAVKNSMVYTQDLNFEELWPEYVNYVQKTYTALPPTTSPQLKVTVDSLKNGTAGYSHASQSDMETAQRIREYLAQAVVYDLKAPTLPEGKDFVEWLLSESKTGYSAHYATAMTVMLRAAGVPARYVEGYRITSNDFAELEPDKEGYYTVTVTDQAAHAWVEVFDSRYGWVSIEVTPGFYSDNLAELLPEVEELKEEEEPEEELDEEDTDENAEEEPDEIAPEEDEGEGAESDNIVYIPDEKPDPFEEDTVAEWPPYVYVLLGLAALLVLCGLAVAVLFLQRKIRLARLNAGLFRSGGDQQVKAVYRYYTRLLRFDGLEPFGGSSYLQYAAYLANSCPHLPGPWHTSAMQILLKHRFSPEPITGEERAFLLTLVCRYRENVLAQLKGRSKFRFLFRDVLG